MNYESRIWGEVWIFLNKGPFSIDKCQQLQRRQQKVVANVRDGRCSFFTPRVQLEWLLLILLAVEFGGKICEDAGVHTCGVSKNLIPKTEKMLRIKGLQSNAERQSIGFGSSLTK